MADFDYGSGQFSDFDIPHNAYSQDVMADYGIKMEVTSASQDSTLDLVPQAQAAFTPQDSTADWDDEVRIPFESPPDDSFQPRSAAPAYQVKEPDDEVRIPSESLPEAPIQPVPAAPAYQLQEHIHDAFLAEQLKHFDYTKLISNRQSNKYLREALLGPVSDAHREVLARNMREGIKPAMEIVVENVPPPAPKKQPSAPPTKTPVYKTGNAKLTDTEYLHELQHNSTAALAVKLGCTTVAISYRKTRTLERESARRGVDAAEIAREIDAARVANGVLTARAARSNNTRRVGKAASRELDVDGETASDASSSNAGDEVGAEVQAAEAENMEVDGSDTVDFNPELAGRNLGGFRSWAPANRTPEEVHERMAVSAMVNPADEMDLD